MIISRCFWHTGICRSLFYYSQYICRLRKQHVLATIEHWIAFESRIVSVGVYVRISYLVLCLWLSQNRLTLQLGPTIWYPCWLCGFDPHPLRIHPIPHFWTVSSESGCQLLMSGGRKSWPMPIATIALSHIKYIHGWISTLNEVCRLINFQVIVHNPSWLNSICFLCFHELTVSFYSRWRLQILLALT